MRIVKIPQVLRDKLGEEGVDALVDLINAASASTTENGIQVSEEKFARRLTEATTRLENLIMTEVAQLRQQLTEAEVRLIRWMVVFWIGQLGAIPGILFVFFR